MPDGRENSMVLCTVHGARACSPRAQGCTVARVPVSLVTTALQVLERLDSEMSFLARPLPGARPVSPATREEFSWIGCSSAKNVQTLEVKRTVSWLPLWLMTKHPDLCVQIQ